MSTVKTNAYPEHDATFYGHGVSAWGEDGDQGVIIWGHGRDALAALNAYERYLLGHNWHQDEYPHAKWEEIWVVFREDCGCTPAEHADAHCLGDDVDCDCIRPGLPPCGDVYSWTFDRVQQDTPGALPVTEVLW